MNTSVEEFVEAFKQLDAETIIVMPNNSNIEAAAKQASVDAPLFAVLRCE